MKNLLQRGLTVVELAIGLVVLASVSAMALPMVQDHSVRGKVAGLIDAANACRAIVTEAFGREHGARPARGHWGCELPLDFESGQYAAALDIRPDGTITVASLGASDLGDAGWTTISLTPYKSATEALSEHDRGVAIHHWVCGPGATHPMPRRYLPVSCQG